MVDVYEINAQTGATLERDYTEAETDQRAKDLTTHAELAQIESDRQALKAATIAKLGLTADEVAALLS
jgi:hypothetical protein